MGKDIECIFSSFFLTYLHLRHVNFDSIIPPKSSSMILGFWLSYSSSLSSIKFRNYCASCWSYPENIGILWFIAFLKSTMLNFYLSKRPFTTLERSKLKGCFFSEKLALRKNWSNIEVDTKDCKVEFMKHVFPTFGIPQNKTYFS